jgi:hypothetical protein
MVASPVITGLMGFFTLVTLAAPVVLAFRFTPRWLERSTTRRITFHRNAVTALHRALAQTPRDTVQYQRLLTQFTVNRAALQALAPQTATIGIDEPLPALSLAA